ncbi:glycosyltransferase [Polaribacter aestuariivivens]|uniref:Glycosyltransferase n=1 Tax=Polaribacter aestuariivivens TaxID=2304626 RepID=A0A5S3N3L2_9FLAO|nr:glycosyltransferase [Polaribacter aestuariivivens]TMM29905.1 glycosyltransferase [Polaribacter aestuariivivens]
MKVFSNKLVVVQTVIPDYRSEFFKEIRQKLKENFELFGGKYYFDKSIKSDVSIEKSAVKNYFLFNRKLLFQIGIWHLLFKNVVLVLEMNPRILSNWIFLVIRRILNKETILWGHAWSKNGKNSNSERLRTLMKLLSTKIIVYTNKQKDELKQIMPKKVILAAPNSLVNRSKMLTKTPNKSLNLIYVGRLSIHKKPFFLVKAFVNNINKYPLNTNLIIVGKGVESKKIEKFIIDNQVENRVKLMGHISDYEKLKNLYNNSFFSVSPSLAGLSITQSFSFGVPMIISKDEKHGPEIEAVKEESNALFFQTDSIQSFNEILTSAFEKKNYWIEKRSSIVKFCKKNYSIEAMSKIFIGLVKLND